MIVVERVIDALLKYENKEDDAGPVGTKGRVVTSQMVPKCIVYARFLLKMCGARSFSGKKWLKS